MSTHTPGPWTFDPANKGRTFEHLYAITSASGAAVAYVPMRGDEAVVEANARTLAASVDLREALEGLVKVNEEWNAAVERITGRQPNWTDRYLDAARAALAKAKPQGVTCG